MIKKKTLGIRKPPMNIGDAGVGWVVVPQGLSREEYVTECYRTNTVAINGGYGHSIFRNVKVDDDVMQRIAFPQDYTTFGTAVVWIKDNVSGYPVVIAAITEKQNYEEITENQWSISKQVGDKKVQILLDGNNSTLFVDVFGGTTADSQFNVKLTSSTKNNAFNLFCDGRVSVTATKQLVLKSDEDVTVSIEEDGNTKTAITVKKGGGMTYDDEFGNKVTLQDGKVTIDAKSVVVNGGSNGGVMNVQEFKKFAQAVLQDLVIAQSGGNVTTWMGTGLVQIEDSKFKH